MRVRLALLGIGLGLLSAGCSLVETSTHLVTSRVKETLDEFSERRRNERWAEEAWEQLRNSTGKGKYSDDYGQGFKAGFADFVYQGGDGEPPPLPPRSYRTLHYQTAQGYQAVTDWFAGFRQGAATARDGGHRQWVTGPSSLRPSVPALWPTPAETPAPPVSEVLPPPRTASSGSKPEIAPRSPVTPVSAQTPAVRETNVWRIVCPDLDGGVIATSMGPRSFQELMQTVQRKKRANRTVGGRHTLLVITGSVTESIELDDATVVEVGALLKWYLETPEG